MPLRGLTFTDYYNNPYATDSTITDDAMEESDNEHTTTMTIVPPTALQE